MYMYTVIVEIIPSNPTANMPIWPLLAISTKAIKRYNNNVPTNMD